MNNEYYYSNNTNIYPLPKNKGSDINAIIEETAYFNKQQTGIFYVKSPLLMGIYLNLL